MILVIDNYDSFTHNLVRYLKILKCNIKIIRNDQCILSSIHPSKISHILISPGPGHPDVSGCCLEIIHLFKGKIPIFGVCLGLQCLAQAFGGKIIRAHEPFHGKSSRMTHHQEGIFKNMPVQFNVGRYHSLVADPDTLPSCFKVTAWTSDQNLPNTMDGIKEIMAIKHRLFPIEAVQFHPESLLTEHGFQILKNFFCG